MFFQASWDGSERGFFIGINMKNTNNPNIRLAILKKFNHHCAYCGININIVDFHIDHIIPKSRWKDYREILDYSCNNIKNFNPACNECNMSKGCFTVYEFRQKLNGMVAAQLKNSSQFVQLIRHNIIKIRKKNVEFYFEKVGKQ